MKIKFVSPIVFKEETSTHHIIYTVICIQVYDSRPHGLALEGCGDFAYNFDLKHAYLAYGFRLVND